MTALAVCGIRGFVMDEAARKAFGLRIRALREEAHMTRDQLAEKAGVPVSTLVNWEQGHREPLATQLRKLSVALNIPCDSFFEGPTTAPRQRGRPPKSDTPTAPARRRTGRKMPGRRERKGE
jgi:transcriptional regulator with XRE-family HTH domain